MVKKPQPKQPPVKKRSQFWLVLGGVVGGCIAISLMFSAVTNVGQRLGMLPTWTAVPPSSTPGPTSTAKPTNTPPPTRTPRPTRAPVPTNTPAPTRTPLPTITPRPPGTGFRGGTDAKPVYFGEGRSREVDPPWWPCKENQVKGNRDSRLYHVPTGTFYNNTFEGIDCFDSAKEAEAAGYTESQR